MKVRVWNAYASNNSGSYTIVGELPSEEVARAVAEEMTTLIDAHDAWLRDAKPTDDQEASPLARFCHENALHWSKTFIDDWPDHYAGAPGSRVDVVAIGHQVVVHHPYTSSLAPTFGELFYKRGGRVQHEENHAHSPIVTIVTFRWGWSKPDQDRMRLEQPKLVAALRSQNGPLAHHATSRTNQAVKADGTGFDHGTVTAGAIFRDLVAGVAALRDLALQHGARASVRFHESANGEEDPLGFLR